MQKKVCIARNGGIMSLVKHVLFAECSVHQAIVKQDRTSKFARSGTVAK